MPYKPKDVEGMLTSKLKMSPEDGDHQWFKLELKDLPPIRTKLPRHNEEIRNKLESRIYGQLRVRKPFFHELMDCTKSRAQYEKQVREDPYPPFSVLFV